jgi:osmotically-inducible protein OsmY
MNRYIRKFALVSAVSLAMVTSVKALAAPEPASDITGAYQEGRISATFALNRYLDGNELEVTVEEGVATLTGTVSEDAGKELAQQIALGVSGIEEVDNRIVVDAGYVPSMPSGERSYGEVVRDASITAVVKSKLLWSKHARGLSTNVETVSGKVTLLGTADSPAAIEVAGALAANTPGVESVDNQLTVDETMGTIAQAARESASDLGQSISDTWITTRVKSTLMFSSNVSGSGISVTTMDGVVSLSGNVTSAAEHALAIELAENVRGVSRVIAGELTHS